MIVLVGVVTMSSLLMTTESLVYIRELVLYKDIPNTPLEWHIDKFLSGSSENVVFGDSVASAGVHGLPGFLNLAYPNRLPTIERKIRLYFSRNRPGKVVLQASPHMFSSYIEEHEPTEIGYFHRNLGLLLCNNSNTLGSCQLPYPWALKRLYQSTIFIKNTTIDKNRKVVPQSKDSSNPNIFQFDGAMTLFLRVTDLSEQERREMVNERLVLYTPDPMPEATLAGQSYRRILEYLTSRGARVCMVGMPTDSIWRQITRGYPEFREARNYFRSLAADYEIRYVDMSTSITNASHFNDSLHLNLRGALEFTPLMETACFGS